MSLFQPVIYLSKTVCKVLQLETFLTIIMDHTVAEQPAAILVNHHQTGILQTSQSCGIRSMSVEDDLGIWSGPPDPQMDAGS